MESAVMLNSSIDRAKVLDQDFDPQAFLTKNWLFFHGKMENKKAQLVNIGGGVFADDDLLDVMMMESLIARIANPLLVKTPTSIWNSVNTDITKRFIKMRKNQSDRRVYEADFDGISGGEFDTTANLINELYSLIELVGKRYKSTLRSVIISDIKKFESTLRASNTSANQLDKLSKRMDVFLFVFDRLIADKIVKADYYTPLGVSQDIFDSSMDAIITILKKNVPQGEAMSSYYLHRACNEFLT
jgi:hypothetical protein